ncbi:MAG: glycosyltransferase [Flavobacteriales bacterium]
MRHAEVVAKSFNVTALVVQRDPNILDTEIQEETQNGVRIVRVYFSHKGFLARRSAFKKGWNYIQQSPVKFDLVQMNVIWKDGWQAVYLKKKYGLKFVVCEHWTGYHESVRGKLSFFTKAYIRWVANKAELLMPVTNNLGTSIQKLGIKTPFEVVPNVVNTNLFFPIGPQDRVIHFMHISHLENNHKNIQGILNVWKKFSDNHQNVYLRIGGDGDLDELENRVKALQIRKDSIEIFGTQTPKQVANKMSRSDVFILFSNYENMPLVIIEAISAGLRVITTDVGGIREEIGVDNLHEIITPGDEESLLKSLQQTHQTEIDEKHQIRALAVAKYSEHKVLEKFTEIYERLF